MVADYDKSHRKACLARAIAAALVRRYPHHTAKYVAQDLSCTTRAAINLLDGHLSSASITKVICAYGPGWVAERVLEAAGSSLESYIANQAAEAERAAADALERAREVKSLGERLQAARRGRLDDAGPHLGG